MQSLLYSPSGHLPFVIVDRRRVPPRRTSSSALRSGRFAPGNLKMVNQVYRQVVRDEISAERASDTSFDALPNSEPIYPLWTGCAIALCLSAIIDSPSGIWGVPVDMFIVGFGRLFSAGCNSRWL